MSMIVGLTGGIASGKSTIAEKFIALGIPVLDADQVARDVVELDSEGLQKVAQHFGSDILNADGSLNRRALREIVFNDTAARKTLEQILHPLMRVQMTQWCNSQSTPYAILMVPTLIEHNMQDLVSHIVVIDVSRETQKQRLLARDSIDESLAESMLNAQLDREARNAHADDILDNSGTVDDLSTAILSLHAKLLSKAQTHLA